MRFISFILFLILPSICLSQEIIQEARPTSLFEQALRISCQINYQNPKSKKYDKIMEHIREIGYRIAGQTNDSRPFTFNFIDDASVNAFALPGGFIFITKGMIELKLSDDEWAQLLAHELTHIIKLHHEKGQSSRTALSTFSLFASILLQAIAAHQIYANNKNQYTEDAQQQRQKEIQNLVTTTMLGSYILNYLNALRYTRELEREADFFGRKYAAAAGYDPNASESLFNKLSKSDNHHVDNMWRSHPKMLDREYVASLSTEKRVEKDFGPATKIAKDNAQSSLLQYATYFSSKELVSIPSKPGTHSGKIGYYHLLIMYLSKLVIEVDRDSPYTKKALQIVFEQSLILKSFGNETPNWGVLFNLYQELDPTNKNCLILEPLAKDLYKELTESFDNNRAGIPTLLSLIKNFPDHPQAFAINIGLITSYLKNNNYEDIPDIFLKNCVLIQTEKQKNEMSKVGKKYIHVCKSPYLLFKMMISLDNAEFSAAANKAFLKIITKCESLIEIIKTIEEESLSEVFTNKETIKEGALKKTFRKAQLKEKQQMKGEAGQLYKEIILYGGSSPFVALAEAALKTLGYE